MDTEALNKVKSDLKIDSKALDEAKKDIEENLPTSESKSGMVTN